MKVEMMLPSDVHDVYLEGMKDYGKELGKFAPLTPSFKVKQKFINKLQKKI